MKSERLCSKKLIGDLFKRGEVKKFRDFRLHSLAIPRDQSEYHQVLISIPARLIKKATARNTIRRRLRESYRKNKFILYSGQIKSFSYLLAYVYISNYIVIQKILEEQVIASLDYLVKKEKSSL
ncbi:MAG TPA: ribonuclease P protein component [Cyclobacteriaceae bacterium]|nr:ribonuclease P protein component [Cyclobacteriaceae bacterium]